MCWLSFRKHDPLSRARVSLWQVLSSGVCGCQGYDLSQGDDYEHIFNTMTEMSSLLGDFDAEVKRKVVAALCTTPMNDGDHLQARGPVCCYGSLASDPVLWHDEHVQPSVFYAATRTLKETNAVFFATGRHKRQASVPPTFRCRSTADVAALSSRWRPSSIGWACTITRPIYELNPDLA